MAPTPFNMTSRPRIGLWLIVTWLVLVAIVIATAFARGIPLTTLFISQEPGRLTSWQAMIFSISMSIFGFWLALTTNARYPDGSIRWFAMRAKGGGWIFAIGGIIVALRVLGVF